MRFLVEIMTLASQTLKRLSSTDSDPAVGKKAYASHYLLLRCWNKEARLRISSANFMQWYISGIRLLYSNCHRQITAQCTFGLSRPLRDHFSLDRFCIALFLFRCSESNISRLIAQCCLLHFSFLCPHPLDLLFSSHLDTRTHILRMFEV